jgi:hypothetical protein
MTAPTTEGEEVDTALLVMALIDMACEAEKVGNLAEQAKRTDLVKWAKESAAHCDEQAKLLQRVLENSAL